MTALGVRTQRFDIGNSRWEPGGLFANSPAEQISPGSQYFAIDGEGATFAADGTVYAITGSGSTEAVTPEAGTGSAGGGSGLVNGVFTIRGTGNGHNVGMSQWGAFAMAHYHNKTFEDIIHFYFNDVQITRANTG